MSPAEREKNDTKLLMSVAALVAGGALVIVLLAGLARDSGEGESAATAAQTERAAPTSHTASRDSGAAIPAAFERKAEPVAPLPTEAVSPRRLMSLLIDTRKRQRLSSLNTSCNPLPIRSPIKNCCNYWLKLNKLARRIWKSIPPRSSSITRPLIGQPSTRRRSTG